MGASRMCVVCQQPIEPERAEALPNTRLCTRHARQIQKYGGEFTMTAVAGSGRPATVSRNDEALRKVRIDHEMLEKK